MSIESDAASHLPTPAEPAATTSWALYLLSPVPTAALCDDLIRGAASHEDTDTDVQFLLLLEAYLLLQNKVGGADATAPPPVAETKRNASRIGVASCFDAASGLASARGRRDGGGRARP